MKARSLAIVCLFILCSAVLGEDFERMLEVYRKSGYANVERRLREYEALQEMRWERRERHLPAGSRFDFARESFRQVRAHGPGETDAGGCAWTSAGPTNLNGRVNDIAVDPDVTKNIYAATVGGLWRSTTAARRWQRVSDEIMAMRFSAVAVNPGDTTEIFAGAGDRNLSIKDTPAGDGLWRSNSSGAPGSWTAVAKPTFLKKTIYRIRIDPAPPHDVYVAATNGVWRGVHDSSPEGITFTALGPTNRVTHDIAIDFVATPPTIYAAVRRKAGVAALGIYKWNGSQWDEKNDGIDVSSAEVFSLAISQSNPNILYTKVSQWPDQTLLGIFKTMTSAEQLIPGTPAWVMLPLGEDNYGVPDDPYMGWYNTMLEVDPANPDRVFAGGINMFMSHDGGWVWENVSWGKDPGYKFEAHADFHALAFDPKNPDIIYVGNDGGMDRTDLSKPDWHWTDVSHGMIISMFYYMTSNRLYPTLLAGGLQDNGTAITFGNRTWYNPGGGDGFDVGSDAGNPDTLYASHGANLYEMVNPVPGTPGGPNPPGSFGTAEVITWNTPVPLRPPLITDMVRTRGALAGGGAWCQQQFVMKTVDGIEWKKTNASLPAGGSVVALASAPNGDFDTYLAAVAYKPDLNCLYQPWIPFKAQVIRSDNGGVTWDAVSGLPAYAPASIAFDSSGKPRSYVTYTEEDSIGKVYMSINGGPYQNITGTLTVGVRKLVSDPSDPDVLYAGTAVGMFRGVVDSSATPPTAKWDPFDQGLPNGLEINDLWVDPQTGILTLGSFGYGAFRRDIRKGITCPARMLVVRDTVYDDGREPSLSDVPDAEHPIPDYPFYKPDDTTAGKASWWTSRDIRIDVPSKNPPTNKIADADSVEFELCPTTIADCLPGTMIDSAPVGNKEARVYVQVTNRGVEPVKATRVIALWNTAGAAFDKLPDTFWTKTFPASGDCGPLDPGTGWHLVDPVKPCRTIDTVTPDMPELARFNWDVPPAADGGATMLTVIESPDDAIDSSIRDENKLHPSEIVPGSRHIALRGLRIIDYGVREPFLWPLDLLKLPEEMEEVEVVVSKVDLREGVRIALPAGLTARAGLGSVRPARVTEAELVRKLESMGLDPNNAWEFSGDEASLLVDLRPGQRVTTGVIATPAAGNAASRVSIVERSRGKVVGGSVMLLRPKR